MNGIGRLLDDPVMLRLGLALMHFLWQGAVVAAVAALALVALRRASATTRYVALLAVLAVMAATPVATYLVTSAAPRPVEARPLPTSAPAPIAPRAAVAVPAHAAAPGPESEVRAARQGLHGQFAIASLRNLLPWAVVLWAAGVVLLSLRLMTRGRVIGLAKSISAELVGDGWRRTMETLAQRLRVTRAVRLLESAAVQVPSVVGWLRPVILLPATALTGLTPEQWQAILAHELAHVRRSDYLINLAQTVVETLLFYHPAVWWVSGRIRLEREHCCDDLAVAACGNAAVYMQALAEMEQLRGVPEPALGVGGGSLLRRVRHLAGADDGRRGHLPQRLAGVVALTLIVASGMGICLGCRASGTARDRAPRDLAMSTSRGADGSEASRSPVPALIAKLKDENPAVRARAIDDLRMIKDYGAKEPAFQPALAALKDEDSTVRAEAAEALPAFRDNVRVLNALVGALRDSSANVRRQAALALCFVGRDEGGFTPDPRVMAPLADALTDKDLWVREAAATSLGEVFGSYSDPGLLDPTVRSRAVDALIVCLRDDSFQVRVAAANALGPARDPRAVEPLIASLRDREPRVRAAAALAVSTPGDPRAVSPLLAALRDKDADVRAGAALGLYGVYSAGGPRPVAPIIAALKDSEPRVRSWAANILGELKEQRAVGPLLIALQKPEPKARANVALALGRIGDRHATPRLLDLLKDEDRTVRHQAGWALGLLGDPDSKARLQAAMTGDDPRPRDGAALALAFMGDDRGVEHLLATLKSSDYADRDYAARALLAADMLALARERPDLLRPRVALMTPFLNDPNQAVRRDIAVALRDMRDPRADDALAALVNSRDAGVRGMALVALGRIGTPRAVEAASRGLEDEDPEVRMQAADALKDAGGPLIDPIRQEHWWAVESLTDALGDEHWGVRAHAAAALRKLTGEDFGQDAAKWRSVQPTTTLGVIQHAGPFQVMLTTASSRFAVGRRIDFWAEVSKDERPVRTATVKLSLETTGTAGFSALLKAERDHYRGSVDFPAGGQWKATLDVTSPEGTGSARYSFNVQ